ncbi:MAG: J domain-containing protein [Desulfonatronovibrionaceae bacterium]
MNTSQCYKILGVEPGADLEAVRRAYRDLAFKYHPDLNPDDPQAGLNFHRINTAYVTLSDVLKNQKPEARAREKARTSAGYTSSRASRHYQQQAGQASRETRREKQTRFHPDSGRKKFFYRQEEILKDILKDPFARQVFEDIFQKIKKGKAQDSTPRKIKKRTLKLEWGKRSFEIDLSQGLFRGVRKWMSTQLDDEQTVYLNPAKLRPGASIRINVQRRWSGPAQSVNITLPDDYVVGRPVRLKGLGRKIGPWKGDLYLRLLAG